MNRRPALDSGRSRGARSLVMGLLAMLALSAGVGSGCGNYSNEDLEFMNAIPLRQDVEVEVPRQANLTNASSAEGWRRTFQVTGDLNRVAADFLSLIDQIRTTYPTTRDANTRIWGPFPADDNPGWQLEFRMSRTATPTAPRFDYALVMIPPPGVVLLNGGNATQIIGGSFDASSSGVRAGIGRLVISLDEARAAGLVFADLEKLRTLSIDYDNRAWPRTLEMVFQNVQPTSAEDALSAMYTYSRSENGDGAMTFSFVTDLIEGAAAGINETLLIESRWLGTGQGREDLSIVTGDGAGATGTECWDQTFQSIFISRSWEAPTGEDPAVCVPRLSGQ